MKVTHAIAFILVIIGGLNWLLVGLISGWDLGAYLTEGVARVVYILVGISAILLVITHKKDCKACDSCCKNDAASTPTA